MKKSDRIARDLEQSVNNAVEYAKDWASPRVEAAVDWAVPRLQHSLDTASPKIQEGLKTATGELYNELPDRIADLLFLAGAGYAITGVAWGSALGWAAATTARPSPSP